MATDGRQLTEQRTTVNDVYTLGNTIGTGHYAVVKLARHVFTEKNVAVKVINKLKLDDVSKAHLFQEVVSMKLVQHPHVVRLYEVIDTPTKLYLILEFADGGDMYEYIMKHANGLNETLARKYFRQICQALKYCHQMRICHRDLKPENLVFFEKQGVVKLADFGFSNKFTPGSKLFTSCGSLAYSAPEILLGDPYDAPAVDMWSLGVILFMLVTGRAPFQEANDSETVMMILDCSYKLPSTVSIECQNLIHRMIVRDPDQRAKLDEVMNDLWYKQDADDEDDTRSSTVLSYLTIPIDDHRALLRLMVDGQIATEDQIIQALAENQYNHITATYYLLAEKILHDKFDQEEQTTKKSKRLLQPSSTNEPLPEQIGASLCQSVFTKETQSSNSKYFNDSAPDPSLSALIEDEDERPSASQQQSQIPRTPNVPNPPTPAQAMKIIPEEDENPETPPADKTILPKLNKIVEADEVDRSPSAASTTTTTGSVLRSKDLRSVVENKRRNFGRSGSSSDSEDNASTHETYRPSNRKHAYSPTTFLDSESTIYATAHRGRSFSNIDHASTDHFASGPAGTLTNTGQDNAKRRSFSRTSSIISNNRLVPSGTTDEINGDLSGHNSFTHLPERTHSLSVDHRLANPSQMSIASRISIRYSTPRESTVFTKSEAPAVVRLIQQTPHQDPAEAIRTIIEHQRNQPEPIQKAIIVEEDLSVPVISQYNATSNGTTNEKSSYTRTTASQSENTSANPPTNMTKPDLQRRISSQTVPVSSTSSSRSMLSTLKYSLIKHQQRKSNREEGTHSEEKTKHTVHHQTRSCCSIS